MQTGFGLVGTFTCTPDIGIAYACDFSQSGQSASCAATPAGTPGYECNFIGAGYAYCMSGGDQSEYNCGDDGSAIACVPSVQGSAEYDCAVQGDTVTCIPTSQSEPAFTCTRQDASFTCVASAG